MRKIVKFSYYNEHCPTYMIVENAELFKINAQIIKEAWYYQQPTIAGDYCYDDAEIVGTIPLDVPKEFIHSTNDFELNYEK